jgi:hypothetical protein
MATRLMEHGSAGRSPAPVTKTCDVMNLSACWRRQRPICVSHSPAHTPQVGEARNDAACGRRGLERGAVNSHVQLSNER